MRRFRIKGRGVSRIPGNSGLGDGQHTDHYTTIGSSVAYWYSVGLVYHRYAVRFPARRCRAKTLGKFLTPSCNVVLYSII